MRIIVCIKQVPNTNEVKINKETGTLIRDGVESIMNPDDMNALEEALRIKEKMMGDAEVIVVSMGPPQAKEVLREAIAMGADKSYLVTDRTFGGSDTWATATIISAAIEKIGNYDLVFCGRQAIDGDTAQVGPEIAEFLNIPQITYAKEVNVINDEVRVLRYTEFGDITYKAKMPVLITAIKELNKPRYPKITKIYEAYAPEYEENINILSLSDLDVDTTQIGLKGSPTNVYKSFVPVKEKHFEMIEGDTDKEKSLNLFNKLKDLKIV